MMVKVGRVNLKGSVLRSRVYLEVSGLVVTSHKPFEKYSCAYSVLYF